VRHLLGRRRREPALFAFVPTDGDGRFALRTIRPATYPDAPIDQHLHFVVEAPGRLLTECRLGFADDPFWRDKPPEPRPWVATVGRGPEGLCRCEFELRSR
jgi:protocatechuate 3,4-dioxygenase beta subunit